MRRTQFVLAFVWFSCIAAAQANISSLIAALSSDDAQTRHQAFESAAQYGPEAIIGVAPLLDSGKPAVVYAAGNALEKIAGAATADEETRKAASNALTVAAFATKNRDPLLWLLAYVGGTEALPALTNLMIKAPESFDAALRAIDSIGRHARQTGDAEAINAVCAALLPCLEHSEGRDRIGIINTLGAVGSAHAVDALIAEVQARGPSADAASQALGHIGNVKALDVLWERFGKLGSDAALEAYLRIVEQQPDSRAAKLYADMLSRARTQEHTVREGNTQDTYVSGDPRVLCAALRGLGRTAASDKYAKNILPFLYADSTDVYGAARAALIFLRDEGATRRLAKQSRKAAPLVRAALMEIVDARDAAAATPILEEGLHDTDSRVRATALRLLGKRNDVQYANAFLEAAQSSDLIVQVEAVRAWLKLADAALHNGDTTIALEMYHKGLELAVEDRDRIAAIEGLERIAAPETLSYLQPFMGNPAIEGPVIRCAFAIAEKMAEDDRPAAQEIFASALRTTTDRGLAQRAQTALSAMGAPCNYAAERGFILRWRLIGPFSKADFVAVFPPESEYRPDAVYLGAGEQQVRWRDHVVEDALGITDLGDIMQPAENVIAYARAEILVDQPQDILVKLGSDDGVICWVNGEKVHENDTARRVSVDEDVKPASLTAGKNVILVKIVQGGGDWGFCARLTTRQGEPLAFRYE